MVKRRKNIHTIQKRYYNLEHFYYTIQILSSDFCNIFLQKIKNEINWG